MENTIRDEIGDERQKKCKLHDCMRVMSTGILLQQKNNMQKFVFRDHTSMSLLSAEIALRNEENHNKNK